MTLISAAEQYKILEENIAEIITKDEFMKKLERSVAENKPLRCKLGIDPSAPDLHLGHAVVLHKLRQFQELGHHIIIILGDFTGMVGDPTGRSETRKQLRVEEVMANARTYQDQIFNILDADKTEMVFNSQWLAKLNFADVIKLASTLTVARMMEREDFSRRYQDNIPISIHEFFYPLMQGYDSIAIRADIEFGATEQKFNLLMGRQLQREYGQEPQVAFTMPILVGTDGVQKMSKSLGNYIGITEPPAEIYGKTMSISDDLMPEYYRLATALPGREVDLILEQLNSGNLHPRDAKMRLAREIVTLYHGDAAAQAAEEGFKQVFQKGEMPSEMETYSITAPVGLIDLMLIAGLASSKNEARRLIEQNGVKVNSENVSDIAYQIDRADQFVVQVGKRKFARIDVS
ncbi:MAG: tyrosine--tRNA ligase [Firmicutes bacterium]|nr:tyrosine--tRNA ligase [Bacillota bacterium]